MRKACPQTGRICPTTCTACKPQPGAYGTRNPQRDLVAHNRWARNLKKATPYCQMCGTTENLVAHHTHGIHDERGMVLCRTHHQDVDKYAR